MGLMRWKGRVFEGRYQKIVKPSLFKRVQERLKNSGRSGSRRTRHDFPYRGLFKCSCGAPITAQFGHGRGGVYRYYPEIESFEHADLVELRATLPAKLNISREACADFLANLSLCRRPIAFEIVGSHQEVSLQFACDRDDASIIRRQLEAHFPEGVFIEQEGTLEKAWNESPNDEALVVEFGLAKEFMFQLRTDKADPFVGIVGALSQLAENEIAVFQVLFELTRANWRESDVTAQN